MLARTLLWWAPLSCGPALGASGTAHAGSLGFMTAAARFRDRLPHTLTGAGCHGWLDSVRGAADGRIGSELSRRIGMARRDFNTLQKVWRHSSVTRVQKLRYFGSFVESKLLYGLATACFRKQELRRLDGFQSKCLRVILGILPSYLSRISNEEVRRRAGTKACSELLLNRQLLLLGKVLRQSEGHPGKEVSFIPGTWVPATSRYVRRVGRPRKEWVTSVLSEARTLAGTDASLKILVQNQLQWKSVVTERR